ncbi:type II toxin-antitoxin system RelE/ParE family toxin [Arenibaculum sp.]|jgi:hypothetical protein|uniref:type II toxin-antitoxin system RelE/ParE family toxin n=1 Tax=Arenibaculum sp. TaxID=2865862 RepID=UPI002E0E5A40|nr:type II toxin-antitoxin system RelE/ParE family toxin [Arenibaculum sp.]
MNTPLQTLVQTTEFQRRAMDLLTEAEIMDLQTMIAADPECGDLIKEGGGIRKVRFALRGRGKSGGVRVIYYYHSRNVPIFLLTLFAKNEKANLSKAERNALAAVAKRIANAYGAE